MKMEKRNLDLMERRIQKCIFSMIWVLNVAQDVVLSEGGGSFRREGQVEEK